MTSINHVTYESKANVNFPFELSDFRRHPQKTETFEYILSREFLGIILNLGEPFEYCGGNLLPGTFEKSHYNLVYLPATTYAITAPNGLHHSLAMRLNYHTLSRSALDFPFLQSFLKEVDQRIGSIIRIHHLPIPTRMLEEIDALLYNVSRDEFMRNLFMEVKIFGIYFEALRDMAEIIHGFRPAYVVDDPLTKQILDFVKRNYNRRITIEDLSMKFGINKRRLQDGFKLFVGKNVHEYVVQLRMEVAKKKLSDPSKSVKSIALEVGYAEVTGFYNAYRKHYNQAPTAMRNVSSGEE